MSEILEKLKGWFGRSENALQDEAKGGKPVAQPTAGVGGDERETSTNAQAAGAADEPWSGS